MWAASKRSSGAPVTCVMCRAPWPSGDGGAGGGGSQGGGGSGAEYVNLSQYSEAHAGGGPSLADLYGSSSYFVQANAGQIGRRQAARLYMAAEGRS
ncbi:hypothetical protein TSOC_004695 [Tetrabaena socialis]|uniref:Uncharacterized protein n=1 Tax=Tetrabaena socialis TaxID=47790 RepID=A0A2J8A8A5_9CHLO|nr:hypothetical protein TSOC_004695 [Tetrabaena socialis]|eukprot:PNH08735.1 hypothetical protein TSOC_004695 [Tetrabaena socialis]